MGNQKDFLGNYLSLFPFSFFLKKKKQKFKAKDQLQSFLPSKSQRSATRKIVVRSLSPKTAALLPTYDKCDIKQLKRLSKLVKCVKYEGQNINCNVFTYYGVNPQDIEKTLNAKVVHQHICNNMDDVATGYKPSPKTTTINMKFQTQ